MVVGAPNIDDALKASHGKLIIMIGDIGREIRRKAVGAHEHLILFAAVFSGAVPKRAVLLIGHAAHGEHTDRLVNRAVVQLAFAKPHVVMDAVAFQVRLELFNVARKREIDERLPARG